MLLKLSLIFTILSLFSCTIKRTELEDIKPTDSTQLTGETPQPSSKTGRLYFSPENAMTIYSQMVKIEKAQGSKVNQSTLHTTKAVLRCEDRTTRAQCFLVVALKGKTPFAPKEKLILDLANDVWAYFIKERQELSDQATALADLICDYVGEKNPAFKKESAECYLINPRMPNEAIIIGKDAETLVNLFLQEMPVTASASTTVNGTVLCQLNASGRTKECVLRPMIDGQLKEQFISVPSKQGSLVGERLIEALKDDYAANKKPGAKAFKSPKELLASIVCSIDRTNIKILGRYVASCRIAI